ncbi:MAG TPA: cell division protein ZapA [Chitinophagaceae bacterium]|nr:cell division protein ZapA [Chitinophagaceae bacterium]MCB9055573.1 cell division protein ZapA [Chitinophagales bacterium]HPG10145.1 cell division protein ZapA [Chitinophagaceae bacterium]HRX93647.1 cell division protein ZapA [Chitinophagaceae bacterium]
MSDLIAISAVVGDRNYRIKVNPNDEEVVRKTLKLINDKIIEFKTQFAGKDMQDYIAMVLIWYATEQNAGSAAEIDNQHLIDSLESIEKLLDDQLNN